MSSRVQAIDISDPPAPTAADLLRLEALGGDRFRSTCNLDNFSQATFGGQALGQALAAAQRTVPGWPASSLGGWFLRAGRIDQAMNFAVERVSDSRRFATRRVLASQGGRAMFDMTCAFHEGEAGAAHQFADPPLARPPEDLPSMSALVASNTHRLSSRLADIFRQPFPVEIRLLEPEDLFQAPTAPKRDYWIRVPSAASLGAPGDHQALLALMSDYWLPGVIAAPHQGGRSLRSVASLNHALWLHAPARVDEWLLYSTDSHWAANGRGLARGLIHDRRGRLVASVVQEALIRWS